MLRYRSKQRCYVGDQVLVTVTAFDATLARLLQSGYQPEDAHALLLLESEWDVARTGVRAVGGAEAIDAVEQLLAEYNRSLGTPTGQGQQRSW